MSDHQSTSNFDEATVRSFGDEWSRYDQSGISSGEMQQFFEQYFHIFPWDVLPVDAEGFDMGCGSGRWAKFVAPRVGLVNCIDASREALDVALRYLSGVANVRFHHATANNPALERNSQDFGYSLGVLHHIPDTQSALAACVDLLKPGAPFLVYLYYRFDNRPRWFRVVWQFSEIGRRVINRLPPNVKSWVTDIIAYAAYWPIARASALLEAIGVNAANMPLFAYRNASIDTMRTDSRDRFGTPLEQRFTRSEIQAMMSDAGLTNILFSTEAPYWCAVGFKEL